MKEIKILTPIGMLGYGVPEGDFERGLDAGADVVIVDSGSTDPGPYQLGLGETLAKPEAYARDLRIMLKGCTARGVPLIISSAGGPGTARHVDDMVATIQQIAEELGKPVKIAAVYADVSPELVSERFASDRIEPCASAPALTQADIDQSVSIVAQMGAEPIYEVLRDHPDVNVVVAGRAYDPAPYAAFCMLHGIDPGIYWHMGKILECGGVCAEPKGKAILATVRADSFDLEPINLGERCTPTSVAAHTLYEKSRPDLLAGPGGVLDLRNSRYEALDERRVRVSGSTFHPSANYQVKLEGAAIEGYRTIFIGGVRDPILIGMIDKALIGIRQYLQGFYPQIADGQATVNFHVYGKHAVMGEREPLAHQQPHEVGILGEVTAETQQLANAICSTARIAMLHMPYPGQLATGGNFAIPLNPPENPIGPVCRFSLYHLMELDSPTELFPYRLVEERP